MGKALHFFYWPKLVASDTEVMAMKSRLSAPELNEVSTAKSIKRQFELIKGRTLLRSAFHQIFDLDLPKILPISKTGKPLPHDGKSFNLSHSQEALGLVVGERGELGLDIELDNPARNYLNIVKSYGSKKEVSIINESAPHLRSEKFYANWCLKESYGKASGHGLDSTLKEIEFNLNDYTFSHSIKKPDCYFKYVKIDGYHVSICHFSQEVFLVKSYQVSIDRNEINFSPFNIEMNTIT